MLLFWLVILLYMSTSLYQSSDISERTERQLIKAMQELDALKIQNNQLQSLARELRDIKMSAGVENNDDYERLKIRLAEAQLKLENVLSEKSRGTQSQFTGLGKEPSLSREQTRRKVINGVVELWYYIRSEIARVKERTTDSRILSQLDVLLEDGSDMQKVILTDLVNLTNSDGLDKWREQESRELGDIVQSRIRYLQNPSDCYNARKLVCNLNKGCGYGCQIHHLVYCFMIAYGTERTLILDSRGWRYSSGGWEKVFKPLSDTCTDKSGKTSKPWGGSAAINDVQVVELPIVDSLHPRPPYMPLVIPEDLAPRLQRIHGAPAVWFIGQFLKYMLRPQADLQRDIDQTTLKLGFKNPVVGVHVRRTDKVGTEAAFHDIEEYMFHVTEWYKLYEKTHTVETRRVYLATDDPALLNEARSKYRDFDFISDNEFSRTAGLGTRYSDSSLRGIILDIHFLSLSDYLVCTFSSQVCRLAYEIMQTMYPDASDRFHSLDDIYYFGGQNAHNQIAISDFKARNKDEIDLKVGDLIGIAGNHWDGFSKGLNRRTGRNGLYPSYKVGEQVDIVKFPTYPKAEVKKFR